MLIMIIIVSVLTDKARNTKQSSQTPESENKKAKVKTKTSAESSPTV